MNPEALLESPCLRQDLCNEGNTNVLDRVGQLVTLPNTGFATTEQVAKFYEVKETVIKQLVFRNKDELIRHGYNIMNKKELARLHYVTELTLFKSDNYRVAIFPRPAILLCGCLLRDSPVAKMVRSYLIQTEQNLAPMIQKIEADMRRLDRQISILFQRQENLENQSKMEREKLLEHEKMEQEKLLEIENWLSSIEKHLEESERSASLVETRQSLARVRIQYERISQDQVKRMKEKAKFKRNSKGLWLKFDHYFQIHHYWELPAERFPDALKWLESQP